MVEEKTAKSAVEGPRWTGEHKNIIFVMSEIGGCGCARTPETAHYSADCVTSHSALTIRYKYRERVESRGQLFTTMYRAPRPVSALQQTVFFFSLTHSLTPTLTTEIMTHSHQRIYRTRVLTPLRLSMGSFYDFHSLHAVCLLRERTIFRKQREP